MSGGSSHLARPAGGHGCLPAIGLAVPGTKSHARICRFTPVRPREAAKANGFGLRSISVSGIMPIDGLFYLANNKYGERYGPEAVAQLKEMIRREIADQESKGRQVFVMLTGRPPIYLSNEQPVHPTTSKVEPGPPHAFTVDGMSLADFDTVVASMRATVQSWTALVATVVLV